MTIVDKNICRLGSQFNISKYKFLDMQPLSFHELCNMLRWLKSFLLQFQMSWFYRKLTKEFRYNTQLAIEHGRPRKTEIWGRIEFGKLIFLLELDTLSENPYLYRIEYDLTTKAFFCYARYGDSATYTNVLQFTAQNLHELELKLWELIQHVPVIRERLLRHLAYNLLTQDWSFVNSRKIKESVKVLALETIREMHRQERISNDERVKATQYAQAFQ